MIDSVVVINTIQSESMLENSYFVFSSVGILLTVLISSWLFRNQRKHNIIGMIYKMVDKLTDNINLQYFNFNEKVPNKDKKGSEVFKQFSLNFSIPERCIENINKNRKDFKNNKGEFEKVIIYSLPEKIDIDDNYYLSYIYISRAYRSRIFELLDFIIFIQKSIMDSKLRLTDREALYQYLDLSIPTYLKYLFAIFYYYEENVEIKKIIDNPYLNFKKKSIFDNYLSNEELLSNIYKSLQK